MPSVTGHRASWHHDFRRCHKWPHHINSGASDMAEECLDYAHGANYRASIAAAIGARSAAAKLTLLSHLLGKCANLAIAVEENCEAGHGVQKRKRKARRKAIGAMKSAIPNVPTGAAKPSLEPPFRRHKGREYLVLDPVKLPIGTLPPPQKAAEGRDIQKYK